MYMNKIKNILLVLLLLGSCILNVVLVSDLNKKTIELIELTDIEPEIIFLDSLVYDTVYVTSKEFVKLPLIDTLVLTDTVVAVDSVYVELPIEVKHFSDTLVNTAISFDLQGYQCKIKDLSVRNFLNVPTQEKAVKTNRFGIGVGIGITYIERFRLVPTVGIYYKLL